ncbi:hypothetical protein U1Q18_051983, partial [Sarracenia purpurea var. burkii]
MSFLFGWLGSPSPRIASEDELRPEITDIDNSGVEMRRAIVHLHGLITPKAPPPSASDGGEPREDGRPRSTFRPQHAGHGGRQPVERFPEAARALGRPGRHLPAGRGACQAAVVLVDGAPSRSRCRCAACGPARTTADGTAAPSPTAPPSELNFTIPACGHIDAPQTLYRCKEAGILITWAGLEDQVRGADPATTTTESALSFETLPLTNPVAVFLQSAKNRRIFELGPSDYLRNGEHAVNISHRGLHDARRALQRDVYAPLAELYTTLTSAKLATPFAKDLATVNGILLDSFEQQRQAGRTQIAHVFNIRLEINVGRIERRQGAPGGSLARRRHRAGRRHVLLSRVP